MILAREATVTAWWAGLPAARSNHVRADAACSTVETCVGCGLRRNGRAGANA